MALDADQSSVRRFNASGTGDLRGYSVLATPGGDSGVEIRATPCEWGWQASFRTSNEFSSCDRTLASSSGVSVAAVHGASSGSVFKAVLDDFKNPMTEVSNSSPVNGSRRYGSIDVEC